MSVKHIPGLLCLLLILPAGARGEEGAPKLDPKKVINQSTGFLREREPEMTAEEYALYEKMAGMLASKPEFALKILETMMGDKEPPSPAFEFILGNIYYAAGKSAKAETSYRSAVTHLPSFLRAWSNLGILYYTDRRYPEAIECFAKTVTLGDREPTTFGLMGYSLEQENRVVPAEMAYMQALSGDPLNTDWLEGLLRIYIRGKQYGRSEWLVKDLLKQRPRESRFWLAYSDILIAQNRKAEATALLEVAVNSGIAGAGELNVLADLYTEQNLVPEAVTLYQKLRQTSPVLGEQRLLHLAAMLIYGGNLGQAREVLEGLKTTLTPAGRVGYLQTRADLFAAQKDWPAAKGELQELLALEPLNGHALLSLGHVHVVEEDFAHAQFAFEAAWRIPGSTYRACLELATLELKSRHYEKSVDYLEKALAIEKTPAVEDYLARVKPLAVHQP